jgi:glycosidase
MSLLRTAGLAFVGTAVLLAQPAVTKVEPPNWWAHTTLNPIRLLIRGRNLKGATISGDFKTSNVRINDTGTYLFADVQFSPRAAVGPHPFTIQTPEGIATADFELLDPLPREHRFAGFSPDDVVYLIMPDRFANGDPSNDDPEISKGLFDKSQPRFYHGGDFKGIRDYLPYLKGLGVTAIWLTPWYDNVNHLNQKEVYEGKPITDYHGYGAVDFYGVEEHFGSLEDLRALIDAAHDMGIKVIQDEVANHCGPYHPWVDDSPTTTWFHGTAENHPSETWQLWPLIDPHSTASLRKETLDGWFINILPDLNQGDPEVSRYLIQNTLWWIGSTGLDAIRMDTLPYVPRTFWHEWIGAIKREYPNVNVVGEVFDQDPAITSFFQSGAATFDQIDSRIDSVFDFPSYFAVRDTLARGKSIRSLAAVLAHDPLYPNPGLLGTFIGNHDVARFMNEPGATPDKLKLAFAWLLTSRGVPTIYYGDEIAMAGGPDPDNRRDFPETAFSKVGRTADQQNVFDYVSTLIHLRTSTPALERGKTLTLCAAEQQWVYARVLGDQTAVIELNNAAGDATLPCSAPGANLRTVVGPGRFNDPLPAFTARISVTSPAHP